MSARQGPLRAPCCSTPISPLLLWRLASPKVETSQLTYLHLFQPPWSPKAFEKGAEAIPPLPILLPRYRRGFIPGLRTFAAPGCPGFTCRHRSRSALHVVRRLKTKTPGLLAHSGGPVWNLVGEGRYSALTSGMHVALNVFRLIPETQGRCIKASITLQRAAAHNVTPRIQRGGVVLKAIAQFHDDGPYVR